jgi:hypothetical protein
MIITTMLVALAVVAVAGIAASVPPPQQGPQGADEVELRLEMQHLWETHVRDLNDLIGAEINDDPNVAAILDKSLEHVALMAASLAPFYGQDAANSMDQLLRQHEMALYDYVVAAEAGDQAGMQAALADSAQVNSQIAECLSSLNPNWPFDAVKAMFDQHANDAVNVTQLMVAQNFMAALDALDAAVEHARMTADVMSDGLVAQFPERFDA